MRVKSKPALACAGAVLLLVSACGSVEGKGAGARPAQTSTNGDASASGTGGDAGSGAPAKTVAADVAMHPPGKLTQALLSSDVLVYSQNTLDTSTLAKIKSIKGVEAVEPISLASFFADQQEVTYAAVNPATFRRFTPPGTAQTQGVWDRVAAGEIAVEPAMGRKIQEKGGFMRLGNENAAQRIHIGAYAQILPPTVAKQINAVVNDKWADKLGMPKDNALLVAMGSKSPQSVKKLLQRYAGDKASVQILGPNFDTGVQTAVLTGGSVSAAVGTFNYQPNPDGSVTPDPKWVSSMITTEQMPIIGSVTGNRVMLPQLRAALGDVVLQKLTGAIYHYDGCYVPRFIGHDPSKGLSFHTFGTAIDLNAADNGRGTAGKMDRRVVAIFKKWGFAWGGDWHYTDPMHFELAKLARTP